MIESKRLYPKNIKFKIKLNKCNIINPEINSPTLIKSNSVRFSYKEYWIYNITNLILFR